MKRRPKSVSVNLVVLLFCSLIVTRLKETLTHSIALLQNSYRIPHSQLFINYVPLKASKALYKSTSNMHMEKQSLKRSLKYFLKLLTVVYKPHLYLPNFICTQLNV